MAMSSSLLTLLLLAPTFGYPQDEDSLVGGKSRAWFAKLSGHMKTNDIGITNDISLDGDLGFGGQEVLPDFSAWVQLPFLPVIDRINFSYWSGSFEETERLEQNITFGNQQFTIGTDLDSKLDFSLLSFSLEHYFLSSGNRDLGCTMGVLLGVKFIEAEAVIEANDFGLREKQSIEAPFPVLGFRALVNLTKWVTIELEMVGSGGKYGDLGGTYFEWFLETSYRPLDWVHVALGFKSVLFGMQDDSANEFEAKMRLEGLFFSVGIEF
jgi:hypothetical protein